MLTIDFSHVSSHLIFFAGLPIYRAEDLSGINRGVGPVRWKIPCAGCIGLHYSEGYPFQGVP